jgi:hypothetical protein
MGKIENGRELAIFVVSLVIIVFLLGGVFGWKKWQPIRFIHNSYSSVIKLTLELRQVRPDILEPIRSKYPPIKLDLNRTYPGYTVVQGMFNEGNQLRLIDLDGNLLHTWDADYFSIWSDPEHIIPQKKIPKNQFSYHTQGMLALPDGSVVINFNGIGLVRMGKCGEIIWKLDRMTHHSITPVGDGSYWVPAYGDVRNFDEKYLLPGVTHTALLESVKGYEDLLLLVDAEGKVVKEFSVLKMLFDSDINKSLYDVSIISPKDPTHVNDIEIVTKALADKIPGVEVGDLLISSRQTHSLFIVDKEAGKIKLEIAGSWIRQHDPDITLDGNIIIFNNVNLFPGSIDPQRSSILLYDPETNRETLLYTGTEESPFYSKIMGTQQLLPNGNLLITESMAGRVFEIEADTNNIVWEWRKHYDESHATIIEGAIRYKIDYFQVDSWTCV